MKKPNLADAYAAKKGKKPEDFLSGEGADEMAPDNDAFLSGEGEDSLSDMDMHLFEAPHLDEDSPLKRQLRKRMSK